MTLLTVTKAYELNKFKNSSSMVITAQNIDKCSVFIKNLFYLKNNYIFVIHVYKPFVCWNKKKFVGTWITTLSEWPYEIRSHFYALYKSTILTYLLNGNLTEIAYPTVPTLCFTRHEAASAQQAAITTSTTTAVRSCRGRLGTSRCIARPHTSPAGYLASMAPEFRFQSGVYPGLHIRKV